MKNPPTNAGDTDAGLIPGSRRSPGKGMAIHSGILAWKIPRKRSLVGYSPWHCKESDVTEQLSMHPKTAQAVLLIHSDGLCLITDTFRPFIFEVLLR